MSGMKQPWDKYRVGKPSTNRRWTEPTCVEFSTVSHVAHLEAAISIVKKQVIRPSLISDESKLKKKRILVNWLSPNYWTEGSIYGGVCFDFKWKSLINGCNYYWVEDLTTERQSICRFLITRQDRSANPDLKAYDPAVAGGPWWYESKAKKHYYNGRTTMEFMVEDELNVSDVDQINFVNHHSNYCSLKDSSCREKGMNGSTAAALFLAGVVANRVNMKSVVSKLRRGNSSRDGIRSALNELLDELASQERWNASVTFSRQSKAVARAVLAAYFRRDEPETKDLISIFKKKPEVIARCLYELVGEAFGIEASDLARKASREDD